MKSIMIEIKNPGLHTTIQDEGRSGFRSKGVPTSGAMDLWSYRSANHLLNNNAGKAALEFTQIGPTLYFHERSTVVLTGGQYDAKLNGKQVPYAKPFSVNAKSELKVGKLLFGNYGYLTVKGGFHAPKLLGSASYCPNVNDEAKCEKGTKLVFVRPEKEYKNKHAKAVLRPIGKDKRIHIDKGPEFQMLSAKNQKKICTEPFTVGINSSRMAIQLDHTIDFSVPDILTTPVQPGTVQLTPNGDLIVLMRDAQTTGGYARVMQLKKDAINYLAQTKPGTAIQFVLD